MKTFIKVEIDDNTFIELPIECVKECGTFVFDADNIEKWMQNDEIQKQFQFIKDNTLACFVYDIQWALYDACLKVNDELAVI